MPAFAQALRSAFDKPLRPPFAKGAQTALQRALKLTLNFRNSNTLDPRITFTRASSGTHFDSTGRLVTDANDIARFDYDPATLLPRGLLIEESRTNLLLHSRDMTQAAWSKTDVTAARTQVGIDGVASSACLMTEGVATSSHLTSQTATVVVGPIAISVVAKAGTRSFIALYEGVLGRGKFFNLSNGTVGGNLVAAPDSASIQSLGGGWYRCSIVVTAATTTASPAIYISTDGVAFSYTGTGGTVIVDCAQLEVGAFATSPIVTGAATATRAADVASMTGANFSSWFNPVEGTFVAEASSYAIGQTIVKIFSADDGTTSNRVTQTLNDTGFARFVAVAGGALQVNINLGANLVNAAVQKTASAYAAGNYAAVRNGLAAVTASGTVPAGLTVLNIGAEFGGSAYKLNGHLRSLRYYNTRLSNAQLQSLTL